MAWYQDTQRNSRAKVRRNDSEGQIAKNSYIEWLLFEKSRGYRLSLRFSRRRVSSIRCRFSDTKEDFFSGKRRDSLDKQKFLRKNRRKVICPFV
ncbi:hypothetical protein CDAR_74701 [Caerostris darwini]|uniref:Uncharacterized protein n=1 Tax=Caerostris darwini TaxID=1538125 RepID=A0AAV4P000_9ARAC|nr:hypothetical protein CDAR_74701 [Caerostris darwini]